ncbi:MAG: DUF4198 domain-containing protein [Gemmataceae bacterium]
MLRYLLSFSVILAVAVTASAHFVYIVPAKGFKTIQVVMSETLAPDEAVTVDKVDPIQLHMITADGKTSSIKHSKTAHALNAEVPADVRLIYGSVAYDVMQKGTAKPYLLAYHPKAILANCDPKTARLGDTCPAEIVAEGTADQIQFVVLSHGKPVADAEVNLLLPDGSKDKATTDKNGRTKAYSASGRFGLWTKVMVNKPGEQNGKKYDEARHYATLVIDVK